PSLSQYHSDTHTQHFHTTQFSSNDTAPPEIYTLSLHDALPILNATGGGFLTASKQFRHGATSKSRSNTASNSTKHKSPHLSGIQDRKSGSAGMPRPSRMPSSA